MSRSTNQDRNIRGDRGDRRWEGGAREGQQQGRGGNWWERDATYAGWTGVGGSALAGEHMRGAEPRRPPPAPGEADPVRARNPFKNVNPHQAAREKAERGGPGEGNAMLGRKKPGEPDADFFSGSGQLGKNDRKEIGNEAEWERERAKLKKWELTGKLPDAPQLSHLSKFMKKDDGKVDPADDPFIAAATAAADSTNEAVRAAKRKQLTEQAEQEKRKRLEADGAPYAIPDPAYEDHDAATFECETCKKEVPRGQFSKEQLDQLSDCPAQRAANPNKTEGPWRGQLRRVHMRGFGFIDCKAYNKLIDDERKGAPLQPGERDRKDVFMLPSLVEHICGGKKNVIELSKTSELQDLMHLRIRVQFKVGAHPDGKVGAVDVRRFVLTCKLCEGEKAKKKEEEAQRKAQLVATGAPAQIRPVVKAGFDPSAKIGALLGSLRGELSVPAPSAAGARMAPNIHKGSRSLTLPRTTADNSALAGLLRSTASNPMKYARK